METMSALVKSSPDETELRRIPVPVPSEGEVLVRVRAAALCGTDLHIHHWNDWARNAGVKLPFVMGHECCGEVAALGSGVRGLKLGDRVAVETHIPCGKCRQCLDGEPHICADLVLFGVHRNGCFADYAVVPETVARKIPGEISFVTGSVMEPLGTAFRAALESQVGGASVVVLGCGPIGLFAVASALARGAAKGCATDVSPARLAIARGLGASRALDPRSEDVRENVLSATSGVGADVVIDASGNSEAIARSFKFLRKGGRVALVGLPGKPVALDLGPDVVFKEAKITGFHGRRMYETWTKLESLLASGALDVGAVITHVLPLAEWKTGLDLAISGAACKVVFEP